MSFRLLTKALLIWLMILCAAILNGALREALLIPCLPLLSAMMISGLLLCVLIVGLTWLSSPWFGQQSARTFWRVGVLWLLSTLIFEWSFGLFVQHQTWQALLAAYQFTNGNLWSVVLIVTLCAPVLVARWRKQISC